MLQLRHILVIRFIRRLLYRVKWRSDWIRMSSTTVAQILDRGGHPALDGMLRTHCVLLARCPNYLVNPPSDLLDSDSDDEW